MLVRIVPSLMECTNFVSYRLVDQSVGSYSSLRDIPFNDLSFTFLFLPLLLLLLLLFQLLQ